MTSSEEELFHLLELCGIVKSEMDTLLPSLKEEERKRLDTQCHQQGKNVSIMKFSNSVNVHVSPYIVVPRDWQCKYVGLLQQQVDLR